MVELQIKIKTKSNGVSERKSRLTEYVAADFSQKSRLHVSYLPIQG